MYLSEPRAKKCRCRSRRYCNLDAVPQVTCRCWRGCSNRTQEAWVPTKSRSKRTGCKLRKQIRLGYPGSLHPSFPQSCPPQISPYVNHLDQAQRGTVGRREAEEGSFEIKITLSLQPWSPPAAKSNRLAPASPFLPSSSRSTSTFFFLSISSPVSHLGVYAATSYIVAAWGWLSWKNMVVARHDYVQRWSG